VFKPAGQEHLPTYTELKAIAGIVQPGKQEFGPPGPPGLRGHGASGPPTGFRNTPVEDEEK